MKYNYDLRFLKHTLDKTFFKFNIYDIAVPMIIKN